MTSSAKQAVGFLIGFGAILQSCTSPPLEMSSTAGPVVELREELAQSPFAVAYRRILEAGGSQTFVEALYGLERKGPEHGFQASAVTTNLIHFGIRPDYTHHFNEVSTARARRAVPAVRKLLHSCSDKTGVPVGVIASILWIETQFGKVRGRHPVTAVFLSIAMADQPENLARARIELKERFRGPAAERSVLEAKLPERAAAKVQWAVQELLAIESLRSRDRQNPFEARGSWAGAYGMAQFLPSSYVKYGWDGDEDGHVDPQSLPDSICSAGNFLKVNGWGSDRTKQEAAVFEYNRSKGYVNAVLTLAEKLSDL